MRREPKLSSDNELDIKFIVVFTVGFVVVSGLILVAGYALLSATGLLGQGQAEAANNTTATPTGPTARPTYEAIGVPTDQLPEPTPYVTPEPTPTPTPTPVPSPYRIALIQNQNMAGSMMYNLTFSAVTGYLPVDMTRVRFVINDYETTYCDYDYSAMMYYLDGCWYNDNRDKILDPNGEYITFTISAYSLNIPLNRETKLALILDGVEIFHTPLPQFQNEGELGESPDPGNTPVDTSGTTGGSGTGNDPWISGTPVPELTFT
jgi:hypothetical protein